MHITLKILLRIHKHMQVRSEKILRAQFFIKFLSHGNLLHLTCKITAYIISILTYIQLGLEMHIKNYIRWNKQRKSLQGHFTSKF